jgi:hypothetical protein
VVEISIEAVDQSIEAKLVIIAIFGFDEAVSEE